MAEEDSKKVEYSESPSEPSPPPQAERAPVVPETDEGASKDVLGDDHDQKSVNPPEPNYEEKIDDSKALVVVEKKVPESSKVGSSEGSANRDAVLARVATEKRLSLIKAWEESEKSKAENKAHKNLSSIVAWENSKQASVEAELMKIEEKLEKKKAEYVERMKNKIALIHRAAEEKKAIIEAKRGEDILKAEEKAAKYRATGTAPKKLFGCFSY